MIKFKTLRGRLIFYFSVTILITLIISAFVATSLVRVYIRETTIAELNRQADIVASLSARGNMIPAPFLRATERILRSRIIFVRSPIVSDNAPFRFRDEPFNEDNIAQDLIDWRLMQNERRQVINSVIPGTETEAVMVAQPVFFRGELAGAVVLARPLRFSQQALLPFALRMIVAGLVALVISMGIAYLLSRYLTDPLSKMSMVAEEIARGNFDQRVDTESEDEIGALAAALNDMAVKVGDSFKLRQNFIMNVSHELRTPLTSIQGFSEALLDGAIDNPGEERASIEVIHNESKHLARLISDLLDLAKLDAKQFSLNMHKFDINQELDEFEKIYENRAKAEKINFSYQKKSLPKITSDSVRVKQIISNLLDNAFKFTPRGGDVILSGYHENGRVTISVSDSGPGINAGELPNIFKPFYSSKKSQGSGLGLAISKELSEALGGNLSVESPEGKGTIFRLYLPI